MSSCSQAKMQSVDVPFYTSAGGRLNLQILVFFSESKSKFFTAIGKLT